MSKKNKILFQVLSYASLYAVGYGAIKLYQISRKKKAEKMSSADGKNLKTIAITLTNNTGQTQQQFLFDSRGNRNNPNVGVSPNLNAFNREQAGMPKRLERAEFRTLKTSTPPPTVSLPVDPKVKNPLLAVVKAKAKAAEADVAAPVPPPAPAPADLPTAGGGRNQAEAPFKMVCADASGDSSTRQYIPLISAQQFQAGIATVNFRGEILDGECYMVYTMYPHSKVTIILYYEDMPLSDLLDKKKDKTEVKSNMKVNNKNTNPKRTKKTTNLVLGAAALGVIGVGAYSLVK